MSTTTTVIRDNATDQPDPLVLTTKFDSNHEYDAESSRMNWADITATVFLASGNSAMSLDFGIFGNPDGPDLAEDYEKEIRALDRLADALQKARVHLMTEYGSLKEGS